MADADVLLRWRNDPGTRENSRHIGAIDLAGLLAWLEALLSDPNRRLMIAEFDGHPIGMVRADYAEGVYEMSWTVDLHARGQGLGKRMVKAMAETLDGPIRAEIRLANEASKRIAEHAGMTLEREDSGILHYRRSA